MIYILLIIILIVILFLKPQKNKKILEKQITEFKIKPNKKNYFKFNINNFEFIDTQFHNDYRDTINAFNDLAPSQKQIFNLNNDSVKFSNPLYNNKIEELINDFIEELNNKILQTSDYLNSNSGWDSLSSQKPIKTGWDTAMESLNLPNNLYNEPAGKDFVKLINVDHIEKYSTNNGNEEKIVCYLFIKKGNTKDILSIKVSFVINNTIYENYSYGNNTSNKYIVIEEIFIIGILTPLKSNTLGRYTDSKDKFYHFTNLDNNNITSDDEIIKQLNEKNKIRYNEMQRFNDTLEPDFQDLNNIPHLSNTKSYQATQTIYDDFKKKRNYK